MRLCLVLIMFIRWCGKYSPKHMHFDCGTKDFLATFYYTSALQTIALFGLKMNRLPALCGALFVCVSMCALIVPDRIGWIRNVINFVVFQGFLLYVHYMREVSERRMYNLRDQLKIQFRATQKAQVNERKAADSKRRLTSYVFHEVRVPLNTALLAVQNIDAGGVVPKEHEIEFRALEGSLSMMSKVLNDVLDFNRMDAGRFESVHKPYAFHQVMEGMMVPLKIATDARGLELVTEFDRSIDWVAKRAAYQAMGHDDATVSRMLAERAEEGGVVVGDETRLRQVITNLASNATKFTHTGGRLTIRTTLVYPEVHTPYGVQTQVGTPYARPEPDEGDYFGARAGSGKAESPGEDDEGEVPMRGALPLSHSHLSQHNLHHDRTALQWIVVRIEVSDTGCGIRRRDMQQSKLFSAFNQTEMGRQQGGKGTGLGLALVRQIVKLSGGRLGVKSKVNEGSTFWVELPLGVGSKALQSMDPLFMENDAAATLEQQLLDPNEQWATKTDPRQKITQPPPGAVPSALTSVMEQGGLFELGTNRRQSGIVTRTIGDPSTGTDVSLLVDNSDDALDPSSPPGFSHRSSSSSSMSAIVRPAQPRPNFVELPRPPNFSADSDATAVDPSPAGSDRSKLTDPPPSATTSVSATPSFEKGMHVLVVDDDTLTRMLMKRMLMRLGCHVSTAENGEIAVEMITGGLRPTPSSEGSSKRIGNEPGSGGEDSGGQEGRFAAVFLDNQMPVLSGIHTIARLREAGRKDFVIGVTGNALLGDQEEFLEAGQLFAPDVMSEGSFIGPFVGAPLIGVDHVLTKPVLERSLRNMLVLADERRKRAVAPS
ncbi:hypothetical protein PUNSTDRAFT_145366 [Punctularia strigosozonata HHB-11173 SS5]|uniref:uncharacterized protein n=1 Tax=Punctularia strigosozonata (strain HHB-11173) TaxID=741275 RepID=UPI00044183C2|nr:uncharacterized protein PUNSTDRAFT_145366 [Punctularia strigosozonata HHB-11173 SS5]EIN05969.1 hypothetical protein PUNSTDRAFT_145366 [Punctularia strigosozonata HHB-11173 SS5]